MLTHADVGHGVEERDVGARPDGQVTVCVARQFDSSRIDDDQLCASPGGLLNPRSDNRVVLGGIGPADENRARMFDVIE